MDIANIAVSILVPIVSGVLAHSLLTQKQRKDRTMDAILRLNLHLQELRNLIVRYLVVARRYGMVPRTSAEETPSGDTNGALSEADKLTHKLDQLLARQDDRAGEILNLHNVLNNDGLMLQMVLGDRRSKLVGRSLQVFLRFVRKIGDTPINEIASQTDAVEKSLDELFFAIHQDMRVTWRDLNDPLLRED